MEEYFRAKRDLLMGGDTYGDMIAAYPAYWSGLRRLELVILMDARVLGPSGRAKSWGWTPGWKSGPPTPPLT